MPALRNDRIRRSYETPVTAAVAQFDASPAINTMAIKQWEDDVRLVLDTSESPYYMLDVLRARRRLRLLVGETE